MKVRSCFVHVPEQTDSVDFLTDEGVIKPGRYTMYFYGESQRYPDRIIVEDRHGMITSVPKKWVRLI